MARWLSLLFFAAPPSEQRKTIYIQSDSPGADKEANWLPAPKGPFMMAARYYWPKPELLDDIWKSPAEKPVK